jgi:hypothetical protein
MRKEDPSTRSGCHQIPPAPFTKGEEKMAPALRRFGFTLGYGWKNSLPSRTSISRMPMPKHTATNPIVSHNMILRPLSRQRRLNYNPLRDCRKTTLLLTNIGRKIKFATDQRDAGRSGVVAVADSVDGADDFGVLRVFFDQLAEFGDVMIEGAAVGLASRRGEYLRW